MKDKTKNKFVKVRCNNCKNEQVVFEKASSKVKCTSCNSELAKPTGGKSQFKAKIIEILKS